MRVETLGKVSVVMMARAASSQPVGHGGRRQGGNGVDDEGGIERFADHAGRGLIDGVGLALEGLGSGSGHCLDRCGSGLAREGIGVSGVDQKGAWPCPP